MSVSTHGFLSELSSIIKTEDQLGAKPVYQIVSIGVDVESTEILHPVSTTSYGSRISLIQQANRTMIDTIQV